MSGCKDPSSSQDGLIFLLPSPKRIFNSRITHTMMLWLSLVLSKDFWSTMFWLIQAVQLISYLLRPSDRCHTSPLWLRRKADCSTRQNLNVSGLRIHQQHKD